MKHIHFIGIGGAGLSAIAQVLLEKGYSVSGSDREVSPMFTALGLAGAQTYLGHAANQIENADMVIRSSAVPDSNPEVVAALAKGIPVLKRQDFLATVTEGKQTLAVAGTHGKTTTTAMLTWMLHQMGADPSFIVGGMVNQLGGNAHAGKGDYFVIEADEYDDMFLGLSPEIAVVTNIEHEHLDYFPAPEDYQNAFKAFTDCVVPGGIVLVCLDDPGVMALLPELHQKNRHVLGYGTTADAHYAANSIMFMDGFPQFALSFRAEDGAETHLGTAQLQVPGHHNVLNATAALGVIHQLGLPIEPALDAISTFTGAGRRFEVLGQAEGVTVINDYGHHPTEMAVTLEAARSRYPDRRLWAIWQPHTYSRTVNLADRFAEALDLADHVVVLKVFAAREAEPGYSAEQIAGAVPGHKATYAPDFSLAAEILLQELATGDIVIVFSAGDAVQLSQMVMNGLQERDNSDKEKPI